MDSLKSPPRPLSVVPPSTDKRPRLTFGPQRGLVIAEASTDDLQAALTRGRDLPGRLGEQLVASVLVSAEARDAALALQASEAWVELRLAEAIATASKAEPARYAY